MMVSKGNAILALWNSISDARLQLEYETWHAIEHVPERVGLPGFVAAYRYVEANEPGRPPCYLTLYTLQDLGALSTPQYQDLLEHPTPWSARMRGLLTEFCREPCREIFSTGTSHGGWIAALRLSIARHEDEAPIAAQLQTLVDRGQALLVRMGRVDTGSGHPLDAARSQLSVESQRVDVVLLIEHFEEAALRSGAVRLTEALQPIAIQRSAPRLYQLQSVVVKSALLPFIGTRPVPRTDLQQLFKTGDTP